MSQKQTYTILFEPFGKRISIPAGTTLHQAAVFAGIDLVASCNGLGMCASCKVQCIQGEFNTPTAIEKKKLADQMTKDHLRLACQTVPLSDGVVNIPSSSLMHGQQLQIDGEMQSVQFSPAIRVLKIALPAQLSDHDLWISIQNLCQQQHQMTLTASLSVLRSLQNSSLFSGESLHLAVKTGPNRPAELLAILPDGVNPIGLAVDAGSTKIACTWVDLCSGQTLEKAGLINPQISLGEDIVNRIAYANQGPAKQKELQSLLIQALNDHICATLKKHNLQQEQLLEMVLVGNTVIHHLFCEFPVRSLGEAPYTPFIRQAINLPAAQLGLHLAAAAHVYLPPLIAGYVGADHIAALIAARFQQAKQTSCLVDIGTNTEISLMHQGQIYTCSCASGPAFEGAQIRDGMRALPGAIDQIHIAEGRVNLSTIANQPAIGICGSGILSALAQMRRHGIIDRRGSFNSQHDLVNAQNKSFKLGTTPTGSEIAVTRQDVHEIQLAKAAIRSGLESLCKAAGIETQQIDQLLIAGAMGTYLEISDAIEIGMFPDLPLERYKQIGNAASVGAYELLINQDQRQTALKLASKINYIELTTQPDFQDLYISALILEKSENIQQLL
ncbi:MAG: DUF4445 domain-containing protein [Anaerolineaceae bacterium]|nr:DUF4445 domain-containing protein [Anaerolineaceae bacterium]